ncbi:MAG: hypothetical protein HPZ91_19990 [Lentisphaeria bacterium]|nr:hypothetical protein [Lentisphaeria bacterium]
MKLAHVAAPLRKHPFRSCMAGAAVLLLLLWGAWEFYCFTQFRLLRRKFEAYGVAQGKPWCPPAGESRRVLRSIETALAAMEPRGGISSPPAFAERQAKEVDRLLDRHPPVPLSCDFSFGNSDPVSIPGVMYWWRMFRCPLVTWGEFNLRRFRERVRAGDIAGAERCLEQSRLLLRGMMHDAYIFKLEHIRQMEEACTEGIFEIALSGEIDRFDDETLIRWAEFSAFVETRYRFLMREGFKATFAFAASAPSRLPESCEKWIRERGCPDWFGQLLLSFYTPLIQLDTADFLRRGVDILPLTDCDYLPETGKKLGEFGDSMLNRSGRTFLFPVSREFKQWELENCFQLPVFGASALYARCRVLQTGIAVELFRRKYGRMPETLSATVPEFLPELPVYPFEGKPLVMREGESFWTEIGTGQEEAPVSMTFYGYEIKGESDRISVWRRPLVKLEGAR